MRCAVWQHTHIGHGYETNGELRTGTFYILKIGYVKLLARGGWASLIYLSDMKDDEVLKREYPELYRVARQGGTERAFSGAYVDMHHRGMYHCAVCGAQLFSSETKFDSATGWPAFTDPAHTEAVTLRTDDSHGMHRTEVSCKACGAHLGHVFPDGPVKNGRVCDRFCINSVSLDFKAHE